MVDEVVLGTIAVPPALLTPFALLLAAIAVGPLVWPQGWGRHYPKVVAVLAAGVVGYYFLALNGGARVGHAAHDYVCFITLLGSLFVVAGGIHISVGGEGTPKGNVLFLLLGALVSNVIGTTGASVLLIQPWLRLNRRRIAGYHVVFFIFIVSNVGGGLTPVGDPPLFLGYLLGVPFWWVAAHGGLIWATGLGILLLVFYAVDEFHARKETRIAAEPPSSGEELQSEGPPPSASLNAPRSEWSASSPQPSPPQSCGGEGAGDQHGSGVQCAKADSGKSRPASRNREKERTRSHRPAQEWRFEGGRNLFFLAVIFGAVFINDPPLLREALMAGTAAASYFTTPKAVHESNQFSFQPMKEVAILFFGIFATMMPALDWLAAHAGSLHAPSPGFFYAGAGGLSSILDSAPTYLCFMEAIYGRYVSADAIAQLAHLVQGHGAGLAALTGPEAEGIRNAYLALQQWHPAEMAKGFVETDQMQMAFVLGNPKLSANLLAVSMGAVFFGANTYLGNGPNLMVKAMAEHLKIPTPSFMSYMVDYAVPVMVPMLALVWLLFF